jgi:anti-sigma factor RsiW
VLFAAGGLSGWMTRGFMIPDRSGIAALTQEAFYTYRTFGPDMGRPVEIKASDSADLVKWVSRRLRRPVEVPDLKSAGYGFIGGRVVATANGPAGMFMYEDAHGARIVMVLRPMRSELSAPMTDRLIDTVGTVSWVDAGIGYSVVGNEPSKGLHPIASEVRRQVAKQT